MSLTGNSSLKRILMALILVSGFTLSVFGGFRVNHIDSEYHQTLYNKSYFLHNIYHLVSKVELEVKKLFVDKSDKLHTYSIEKFKKKNQKHGVSPYLVNGLFSILGLFCCINLAFLLTQNFWIAYLAGWILCSSYFWNAESHYSTTDVPLSSLIICTLFFLFNNHLQKQSLSREDKIYEGILLGSCFAVKYAGLIFLIPYLFFKWKTKKLADSVLSLVIAFVLLLISIGDKFRDLFENINREYKVQTEEGWAGYNSSEPGFFYHLHHSYHEEYGLILSLLAVVGAIFLYKHYEEKRLFSQTIFLFIACLIVMISSTVIKTVRFSLPSIPLLAIFSALGIYYLYYFLQNKNKNLAKVLTTLLILVSIMPALRNSIKHDYLMSRPDTINYVNIIRDITKKQGAINIILDDQRLFDKTPNLDDIEYIKRCISSPRDFKKIFKFAEYPNLVVSTNSYKLDRFIFDKTYHCDNDHKAFKNYEDLKVLQISPFSIDKRDVPFSFISNFSPRKPDLKYRNHKGGFFELFYTDAKLDTLMREICRQNNFPCKFITGKDSYFLNEIQTSFVDPRVREHIKEKGL